MTTRLLRLFATTALFVAIVGTLGLMTASNHQPETLDRIMYLTIYPAIAAGLITYFWKPRRK